jgi:hypothetical protein
MKKYTLTKIETSNINARQQKIKEYQYLIHVINMDIQAYLQFEVVKRIGLKEGVGYKLSEDNTTITVEEDHATSTKE